ncbi:hypothetical protein [Nocardia xishanensis]|uniref:Uncharacterized protein n=1 Tax=Nocardia xishanensis TaxID=238964 RepID=A0ABW7X7C1_9NOCA
MTKQSYTPNAYAERRFAGFYLEGGKIQAADARHRVSGVLVAEKSVASQRPELWLPT